MKQNFIDSANHAEAVGRSLDNRIRFFDSSLTVAKKHGWEDRIAHYSAIIANLAQERDWWYNKASHIAAQAALIME